MIKQLACANWNRTEPDRGQTLAYLIGKIGGGLYGSKSERLFE